MEKIKTTINCFFFVVNEAGEKVTQPIVIWKSQLPRCFKKFQDTSRPANLHYFSNPKSWMTSEVIEAPLVRFNKKLAFEPRKVILFIDNAMCHPESMDWPVFVYQSSFITKEYNFVATTTRCWHHSKFQVKYQKRLVKYVFTRIQ